MNKNTDTEQPWLVMFERPDGSLVTYSSRRNSFLFEGMEAKRALMTPNTPVSEQEFAKTRCIASGTLPKFAPIEIIHAELVLKFARDNGFPNAKPIYWDVDCPEYGSDELRDLIEEPGCAVRFRMGIQFDAPVMVASHDSETNETTITTP